MKKSLLFRCLPYVTLFASLHASSPAWSTNYASSSVNTIAANTTYSDDFIEWSRTDDTYNTSSTSFLRQSFKVVATFEHDTKISFTAPSLTLTAYLYRLASSTKSIFEQNLALEFTPSSSGSGSLYLLAMDSNASVSIQQDLDLYINAGSRQGGAYGIMTESYASSGASFTVNGNATFSGSHGGGVWWVYAQQAADIYTFKGDVTITSDGTKNGTYIGTTGLYNSGRLTVEGESFIKVKNGAVYSTGAAAKTYLSGGTFWADNGTTGDGMYASQGGSIKSVLEDQAYVYNIAGRSYAIGSSGANTLVDLKLAAGSQIANVRALAGSYVADQFVLHAGEYSVIKLDTDQTTIVGGLRTQTGGQIQLANKTVDMKSNFLFAIGSAAGNGAINVNNTDNSRSVIGGVFTAALDARTGGSITITDDDSSTTTIAGSMYAISAYGVSAKDGTRSTVTLNLTEGSSIDGSITAFDSGYINLNKMKGTTVTSNLNAYAGGKIDLIMTNNSVLTGKSSINNFGTSSSGEANITLKSGSLWNIMASSGLTTLIGESGAKLNYGSANTVNDYTSITLNDSVTLDENTTIDFYLSSLEGVTDGTEFQIFKAWNYRIADVNTITFNLTQDLGTIWNNGKEYALEWDFSTFEIDGTLRVKANIPEPATATLSLLGLSVLLLRRRRL